MIAFWVQLLNAYRHPNTIKIIVQQAEKHTQTHQTVECTTGMETSGRETPTSVQIFHFYFYFVLDYILNFMLVVRRTVGWSVGRSHRRSVAFSAGLR